MDLTNASQKVIIDRSIGSFPSSNPFATFKGNEGLLIKTQQTNCVRMHIRVMHLALSTLSMTMITIREGRQGGKTMEKGGYCRQSSTSSSLSCAPSFTIFALVSTESISTRIWIVYVKCNHENFQRPVINHSRSRARWYWKYILIGSVDGMKSWLKRHEQT